MNKKLYNHHYRDGKIEIKEVMVEETAKLFRSKERELYLYSYQIQKEQLDCLNEDWGCYMVSENPNAELFKKLIVEKKQLRVNTAKDKLLNEEKDLELAMNCEVTQA